jgi:hypothetical protein
MAVFSPANAKTERLIHCSDLQQYLTGRRKVYSFDILSGYSCPYAKTCLSRVITKNGARKIADGKYNLIRCFSASQEALYTTLHQRRLKNYRNVKMRSNDPNRIYSWLKYHLPKNAGIIRIHVSGDFFSQNYFDAWLMMAKNHPSVLFYAYTKSLPFWIKRLGEIPDNFVLTASYGGWRDDLIEKFNLRYCKVFFSEEDAKREGLTIDKTDEFAANPKLKNVNFGLLLHGTQPKGTDAAKVWHKLKSQGFGYARTQK